MKKDKVLEVLNKALFEIAFTGDSPSDAGVRIININGLAEEISNPQNSKNATRITSTKQKTIYEMCLGDECEYLGESHNITAIATDLQRIGAVKLHIANKDTSYKELDARKVIVLPGCKNILKTIHGE